MTSHTPPQKEESSNAHTRTHRPSRAHLQSATQKIMLRMMEALFLLIVTVVLQRTQCYGFQTAIISEHLPSHITSLQSTSFEMSQDEVLNLSESTLDSTKTALSMTIEELEETLGGWGRARLAWDCYSNGVDPAYLFGDISQTGTNSIFPSEYLDKSSLKHAIFPTPRVTQTVGKGALSILSDMHSHCKGSIENGLATFTHISTSSDGTTKLLLRLIDGFEVETVLIPFWAAANNDDATGTEAKDAQHANIGRTTVCISSQVGCMQGCSFCATGKMGKLRSLSADEILVQLFFAKKIVRLSADGMLEGGSLILPPISNIVFMGMGEPADNANSVRQAIKIMTKNELFQLGATRITVSTVAPTPDAFMEFYDSKCVLAWSVHAARDDLRKKLVPTTKYTMEELRQGLIDTLHKRNLRTVMIEVALIADVNDSLREADELADFVKYITNAVPRSKLICNLIPYNDIGTELTKGYRKPSLEQVLAFQRRLQDVGVYSHVRGTRGDEESAACGQLATSRKKKPLELV